MKQLKRILLFPVASWRRLFVCFALIGACFGWGTFWFIYESKKLAQLVGSTEYRDITFECEESPILKWPLWQTSIGKSVLDRIGDEAFQTPVTVFLSGDSEQNETVLSLTRALSSVRIVQLQANVSAEHLDLLSRLSSAEFVVVNCEEGCDSAEYRDRLTTALLKMPRLSRLAFMDYELSEAEIRRFKVARHLKWLVLPDSRRELRQELREVMPDTYVVFTKVK